MTASRKQATAMSPAYKDLTPDPEKEFTETIWADQHIVYIKSGPSITPDGLQAHYARLARMQPQFEHHSIDAFILDFRSLQDEVPYLTLINEAQKARKQIDSVFLKQTLRVFVVNDGYSTIMLRLWGRMTSRFTAVRFCTTMEEAHETIDHWRATQA